MVKNKCGGKLRFYFTIGKPRTSSFKLLIESADVRITYNRENILTCTDIFPNLDVISVCNVEEPNQRYRLTSDNINTLRERYNTDDYNPDILISSINEINNNYAPNFSDLTPIPTPADETIFMRCTIQNINHLLNEYLIYRLVNSEISGNGIMIDTAMRNILCNELNWFCNNAFFTLLQQNEFSKS